MAKQQGIIPLQGTIGNITFSKTVDGFTARQKGGVSASKIASHPNFQRTRENMAEFRSGSKAAKLITTAFAALLQTAKDSRMFSRLQQNSMNALKADSISARGLRNMTDGQPVLLEGFDFNIRGKLATTLFAPFAGTIDRATGTFTFSIPAFTPSVNLKPPVGATHYAVTMAGAYIDFKTGLHASDGDNTNILPINSLLAAPVSLSCNVVGAGANPLLLTAGIQFFQEVNGGHYPLNNGAFNPLAIIKVDA